MLGAAGRVRGLDLNVDKPPMDFLEIERRATQFSSGSGLWLTRAATFEAKSRLFAGRDVRRCRPRFSAASPIPAASVTTRTGPAGWASIERIAWRGAAASGVFGRDDEGRFVGLSDLALPLSLSSAERFLPASSARMFLSAEIRRTHSP